MRVKILLILMGFLLLGLGVQTSNTFLGILTHNVEKNWNVDESTLTITEVWTSKYPDSAGAAQRIVYVYKFLATPTTSYHYEEYYHHDDRSDWRQ